MEHFTADAIADDLDLILGDAEATRTAEWFHEGDEDGIGQRQGIRITHIEAGTDEDLEITWAEAYVVEDVMNGDANPRGYVTEAEAVEDAEDRRDLWLDPTTI